jgi:ATP-dependent RNA helicase DDX49/DBP8
MKVQTVQSSRLIDNTSATYPCMKFQRTAKVGHDRTTNKSPTMTTDYSDSGASDQEILEAQSGARKRRKLSPSEDSASEDEAPAAPTPLPTATISRVKAKKDGAPPTARASGIFQNAVVPRKQALTFASIDVAPWLVASLASMEIKRPTGIQASCIPEILKGKDCIGGSRTGTGKTVAFAVPILQKWAEDPSGIFALIIT